MLKRNIIIFLLLSFIITGCNTKERVKTIDTTSTYYGYLKIPKIDMDLGFYNYDNKLNTVSKNIELIPTGINNTYLIAAHSGSGYLAYFNDLRYLDKFDEIYLEFKDKTNYYKIVEIRREIKDGDIRIPFKENYLILTTCDQIYKGYQLIIEAQLITKKHNNE